MQRPSPQHSATAPRARRPPAAAAVAALTIAVLGACAPDGESSTAGSTPAGDDTAVPTDAAVDTTEPDAADAPIDGAEDADDTANEGADDEASGPPVATATPPRTTSSSAPTTAHDTLPVNDPSTTPPTTTTTTTSTTNPPTTPPVPTSTTPATSPVTNPPPVTAPTTTAAPVSDDVADAAAALRSLLSGTPLVDGAADLPTCVLDPAGDRLDIVFADLAAGPFGEALAGTTEAFVIEVADGYPPMLTCDRFDAEFSHGVGLSATPAPVDLVAFSEAFGNPDGLEEVTVTVERTGPLRGGTLYRVCSADAIDPTFDYCEVDWISDGLMITAWIAGGAATAADLRPVETALATQLDAIVASLATR